MKSVLLAFSALALPAAAHAQAGTQTYADDDGWRVLEQGVNCALFNADLQTTPRLAIAQYGHRGRLLEVTLPEPIASEAAREHIRLSMDGFDAFARVDYRGVLLSLLPLEDVVVDAMRDAERLRVMSGPDELLAIPLSGFGNAIGALEECVHDLPQGPVRPPSASSLVAPPAPAPASIKARGPAPVGRVRWIGMADYPADRTLEGRVRVELSVDARGSVTRCQIIESSGHPALDEHTCNLLQARARFEPARDADGNPRTSVFSDTIVWATP